MLLQRDGKSDYPIDEHPLAGGVFIKGVVEGGPAALDGRLQVQFLCCGHE